MRQSKIIFTSFMSGSVGALLVIVLALASFSKSFSVDQLLNFSQSNRQQPTSSQEVEKSTQGLSQEQLVIKAVEQASPAVVSIVISSDVPVMEQYYDDPFGGLFGPFQFQIPQYRQNGTEHKTIGGGSGFLVSSDGMIVTNKHVVQSDEYTYEVFTSDGTAYDATVVARDPVYDLAVLKIEGKAFPYLSFGDSESISVGQSVVAIGNALAEFQNSVSVGVISGLSRSITAGDTSGQSEFLDNVIQTDAAINPGNSGGPLLNLQGKVIGVNVAVAQGSENIGFALPGNLARSVVESVSSTGKIVRPYIGVRYVDITDALKEKNKLGVDYGILVVRGESSEELAVIPGSPADKAGIEENDIILEINGKKLDNTTSFSTIIRNKAVGDTVTLRILHDGNEREVSVTLAEMPE